MSDAPHQPYPTATWPGARLARDPIAPATTLGAVYLTVADQQRSRAFWTRAVGLQARKRPDGSLGLHAGAEDLVVLIEQAGARPASGRSGLFHLALLLPTRAELARWLAHARDQRLPLSGLSDHWVSEAIYLRDPDGHGIEIYADRPAADCPALGMTTIPLDINDLLAAAPAPGSAYQGMPSGTRLGHVHLQVADLTASTAFYVDLLGFDRTTNIPGQVEFWSAGGYHHHLAGNVWAGRGLAPPDKDMAALRQLTLVLPSAEDLLSLADRLRDHVDLNEQDAGILLRDPSGTELLLVAAASATD